MATYTFKLNLTKPDYSDVRDIKVLNANADRIDKFAVDIEKVINDNKVLGDSKIEDLLLHTSIKGTVVTVTKDNKGRVASITHKRNNVSIRTDTFTYADNTITEVRELTGLNKSIRFVYNLNTLETVVN